LPKPFAEADFLKVLINLFEINTDRKTIRGDSSMDADESRIDLGNLSRVAGEDESFVVEMLEKFIESFEDGYKVMVSKINEKDFSNAGNAAHKLISPSRYIGAKNLVNILEEIEEGIDQNISDDDFRTKADKAKSEFEKIKKQILHSCRDYKQPR